MGELVWHRTPSWVFSLSWLPLAEHRGRAVTRDALITEVRVRGTVILAAAYIFVTGVWKIFATKIG
jgi:hypothetical protein